MLGTNIDGNHALKQVKEIAFQGKHSVFSWNRMLLNIFQTYDCQIYRYLFDGNAFFQTNNIYLIMFVNTQDEKRV
ncbi:hypothetical protein GCM10022258_45430 [Aquimarina gracilis]